MQTNDNGRTPESNPPPALADPEDCPVVNSAEWEAMNERRAELIRKDLDQGLTEAEREEYERLQKMSLAAVNRAFPRPKPDADGEWFGKVGVSTDLSAEVVLSRVAEERAAGKMTPGEAADILFPFLFEGTVHERRRVYAALRELATPEAILETALRTHRREGYEGYLDEATSLLADFKAAAWPAIRKWALAGKECELLVGVITTIEGISDSERRDALMDIAQVGDESARRRVLESIHVLPAHARKEVLLALRGPNDPSDSVQVEAAEQLAEYEA